MHTFISYFAGFSTKDYGSFMRKLPSAASAMHKRSGRKKQKEQQNFIYKFGKLSKSTVLHDTKHTQKTSIAEK